jgi:hypothetical protein
MPRFKDELSELSYMVKRSLAAKKRGGWSRDTGSGFIAADVRHVVAGERGSSASVGIYFAWEPRGHEPAWFALSDLSLREVEELNLWVELEKGCRGRVVND